VSNLLDRVEFVDGDFVRRAETVDAADVVTLDRVVCCYPEAESLVSLSAARAKRLYGLVLPRDGVPIRLLVWLGNLRFRLTRSPYRAFVHRNPFVDRLVGTAGLRAVDEKRTLFWRVVLYARA
jgi:magnesium-protoporphyrin O-methyltransferase